MSLVNRMLQELAERQQGPGLGMEGVRVVARPAQAAWGRKALYFALLVAVLTGALVAARMPWPRSPEPVAEAVRAVTGTHRDRGGEELAAELPNITVIAQAATTSETASAPTATAAATHSAPMMRAAKTPVPAAPAVATKTVLGRAAVVVSPPATNDAIEPDARSVAASSTAPAGHAAADPSAPRKPNRSMTMASAAGLAASPPPANTERIAQGRPEESGEVTAEPPSAVQRERPAEPGAETLYHRAGAYLQRGELTAAEADYRKVLALDPAHRLAREALCALLLDQGRLQDAAGLLAEGLVRTPGYPAFRRMQARILVAYQRPDQAVAMLEQTPPAVAVDPEYHALLAALYLRLGQDEKAVNAYQALVRLRPDEAAWWAGLGVALEARHAPAQALQAYRRAQQTGRLNDTLLAFVNKRRIALER